MELGNKWSKLATFFYGRMEQNLKIRFKKIEMYLKKYGDINRLYQKPEQLIQQPDQIDLALPVQEINLDIDVEENFVQNTIDDSNQSLS